MFEYRAGLKNLFPIILGAALAVSAVVLLRAAGPYVRSKSPITNIELEQEARRAHLPPSRASSPRAQVLDSGVWRGENSGQDFHLKGKGFQARFTAMSGMTLAADSGNREGVRARRSLRLNLREAVRGDRLLYMAGTVPPRASSVSRTVKGEIRCSRTDSIAERYQSLENGMELFIDLQKQPEGGGDLCFRYDLHLDGVRCKGVEAGGERILFVDRKGQHVFQVGRILARDAAGREYTGMPVAIDGGRGLEIAISGKFLNEAAYPIEIDPPILVNPQFSMTSGEEFPGAPTIAASSNQFLVAYADFLNGPLSPVLRARLVGSGGVVSAAITLTDLKTDRPLPFSPQRAQAASNGTDFIVVWSDAGGGIIGAIIEADGTLKKFGDNDEPTFLIAPTTAKLINESPIVAYNGEQFVVVWADRIRDSSSLFFSMVAADGSKASGTKELGLAIQEKTDKFSYLLAPGPDNLMLLLFSDFSEEVAQIRAHRIDKNGASLDPLGIKLFNSSLAAFGFGDPVGARRDGSDGWEILSSPDQLSADALFKHTLTKDGAFQRADELNPADGGVFARMGVGPIGVLAEDRFSPAYVLSGGTLPGGGSGGEWLFVRNLIDADGGTNFLGRRVGFDGAVFDETPFQVDNGTPALRRNSTSASASAIERFLVVWLEGGPSVKSAIGDRLHGALIDPAGDANLTPFTKAILDVVSLPRPIHIRAGESVGFDWSASTGTITKQTIFFGDGKKQEVTEGTFVASHLYTKVGRFVASLRLENGTYQSTDSVVITVGGGTGVEGSDGVIGGVPSLLNTDNMNSALFVRNAKLVLDFAAPLGKEDILALDGSLDLSLLPETSKGLPIAGKSAVITIFGPGNPSSSDSFDSPSPDGVKTIDMILDGAGEFRTADSAELDIASFSIDMSTGTFVFAIEKGRLAGHLVADKGTHKNPNRDRNLEFGLVLDGVDFGKSNVIMSYKATAGQEGSGSYVLRGLGKENTGSVEVTSGQLKESSTSAGSTHTGFVTGRLTLPGGTGNEATNYTLPANGLWKFHLGGFSSKSVDLGNPETAKRIIETDEFITYKGEQGGVGDVQEFKLNRRTGAFTLKVNRVNADAGGIGLPLTGFTKGQEELGINVDLFLGFELIFESGELTVGHYFRMERINARNKAWKVPNPVIQKKPSPNKPSTTDVIKDIVKDILNGPF